LRNNIFYIVFLTILLTFSVNDLYGQELPKKKGIKVKSTNTTPKKDKDTVKPAPREVQKNSITIKKDSIIPKKSTLEGIVKRKAKDYESIDQKTKIVTLYNEAELYYKDIELKAGIIVMDYSKDEVYAGRIKDTAGKYTQLPVFKQGANVVEPDSIRFNFKTKKALVWNSRTQQGEMNVIAGVSKKENDSVYFMKNAKLTTAKDLDNPEYYFLARKAKFVPGKKVVVGLTNMYIADVPTPLGLPFAFFPMSQKSQTGLLLPSFVDTRTQGYSLQNGGYYFAISDYLDLTVRGDYYTKGSYALRFESNYALRYKFSGNVNIRFENLINGERGFPGYSKSREYNIQWSHSKDGKSSPNSRFSASVNLGSSTYFQNSLNQLNSNSRLNNTLSSSVSYSKTINTIPVINFSLSATHSQNTNTKQINMTLPSFQGNVDRIFLFGKEDEPKKGFIKNINLQYNVKADNQIATTDSLFFKPQMFRDAKVGMQHSIPLSTNFKLFKYFSVGTSANYNEVWVLKTVNKKFNTITNQVDTKEVGGFDAFRTYSFSANLGTTIYGTFNFGEDKKIKSIRHVITPAVSYSYTPSFDKYYDVYDDEPTGRIKKEYTRFENSIYGTPGKGISNTIGFSLNNTFEAKVKDSDSTKVDLKKIKLLNALNFSTGYDIAKDSIKWSPVTITASTSLFKEKMNVNFGASIDPYAINNAGQQIDKFNINNGGSLFRLTSANINFGYSFSSKKDDDKEKDKKKNSQSKRNGGRDDDLFGTNKDLGDPSQSLFDGDREDTFEGFFKAKIPWDFTFSYAATYGNRNRENKIVNNSLNFNGNVELSSKWKVGLTSGYDFANKGITYTQVRFERDLLSWRMSFNWVPIGFDANWGFFIGIKSGVLSDIKWDKRSSNRIN
jgi:lipopolysaccharide assembly outer membrane protein LptD (OstA)